MFVMKGGKIYRNER